MDGECGMYKIKWISPGKNIDSALDVRFEVFVHEQHFVDEVDALDSVAHHVVLFDEQDRPFATGRVFEDSGAPGTYIIGRVAVKKHMRSSGLGSVIMENLEQRAAELGAVSIVLGAQLQAKPFYEKLGYAPTGEEYYEQDCPHVKMKKDLSKYLPS